MTTSPLDEQNRITNDEPVSQKAEIPVVHILENIVQGLSLKEIAAQWPGVTPAGVKAALEHAITAIRQPLASGQESQPAGMARDSRSPSEMDLDKILVVDDQPLNCRLVKQILAKSEFTLSFASDGEEGLEKARAELPFLVLSDIMMPRMDGFELCEKLKADDRTKDAAVIFVTAHHRDAAMVSKGLDMGADDYIYRPFQPSELEARVRAVARLKRAEMAARRRAHIIARRNDELEFLNTLALAATSSLSLQESFAPSMPKLSQLLGAEAV
ncbi:MAG: response regulator, partial [Chloroflexota bacterium]|nr:response regulator [Chloroflexota bacterium]